MLTRTIMIPLVGILLSNQFEEWFYMGRVIFADTTRITADNAHIRV